VIELEEELPPLLVAPSGSRPTLWDATEAGGGPAVGCRLAAGSGRGGRGAATVGVRGQQSSAPATMGTHGELPRPHSGGGGRPPPTGSASPPALDPPCAAKSGAWGGRGCLSSCSDASPSPCSAVITVEDDQHRDLHCGGVGRCTAAPSAEKKTVGSTRIGGAAGSACGGSCWIRVRGGAAGEVREGGGRGRGRGGGAEGRGRGRAAVGMQHPQGCAS
jgi:hypothetical protein